MQFSRSLLCVQQNTNMINCHKNNPLHISGTTGMHCTQGWPKMRRKWLSLLPICWLPKFDITLSSCFLLPVLFFLLGHSSGTRTAMAWQMGRSSSSAIVWAGWLEWPGRKTAQTVRNRICSVLSNLGNQQMERSDSHICLVLGSPCPKAATRYS